MSTTLECQTALSDLILQSARAAIPADPERLLRLPPVGELNRPLLPLLVGLLDALQVTATAVSDNAFDGCQPLPRELARDLARQARAIAADLENAADGPRPTGWSLPSMSGKELV